MDDRAQKERFTSRQLIEEAKREAKMRRGVYAKQVLAGRMTQGEADRRIAMMEAIADRLLRASMQGAA